MSVDKLTHREQEILNMMLEGITPKEIAYKLGISYATIDYHRKNLYRKLDIHSVNELFAKFNTPEPEEMVFVGEKQHKSIVHRIWKLPVNKTERVLLFVAAGFFVTLIGFLVTWYLIFGSSSFKFSIYNHDMLILSRHAEWGSSINSLTEAGKQDSSAILRIGKETIHNQKKDVLTLTAYLAEKPNWRTANFVTGHFAIMRMLREGNGIKFKVLGDEEPGWKVAL